MAVAYRKQDEPTREPTDVDWAWAAGFLEGEGCFSPESGRDKRARTCANQKQREPLERLLECFGGRIYDSKKREIYTWVLRGQEARQFLEKLQPMMSTRRRGQIQASLDKKFSIAHGSKERKKQLGSYRGMLGKKHSKESREKMSIARKVYWAELAIEELGRM